MKKPKPPLERVIQRQCVQYLRAAGWTVWQTSVGHKHPTGAKGLRVTPGIPDLYCLHPRHGALWIECKREGADLTDAQAAFSRAHAKAFGAPDLAIVRSLNELRDIFGALGYYPEAA